MKTTKLASIAIMVLLSSSALGSAQRSSTAAYQTNLHERLKLFVEYQRNERWDKVAELLGDYYCVGGRRAKYSQSQKTQMIEDLKARPMLELDLVRTNVAVGSDNISLPMNRQYRWVYAFIRFCDGPNCIHIQSRLVGYMNNRKWFFTPSDVEFYRRDSIGPSAQRRWTGAAIACFASSSARRSLNEFAAPGQLNRWASTLSQYRVAMESYGTRTN